MGCCVSTSHTVNSSPSRKSKPNESRAPPPSSSSLLDEETVKEVLSETPKPRPKPKSQPEQEAKKIQAERPFLDDKKIQGSFKTKNERRVREEQGLEAAEEEISEQEVSEVCSLTFSESPSTTTLNRDDDDQQVRQRVNMMRSPAAKLPSRNRVSSGDSGPKRDRVVGRSPNRRHDQSPGKSYSNAGGGSVRLVQSSEPAMSQVGRRAGSWSDPNRRDLAEGSGRRSRSPATNRSAMGRSPSALRANRSPGRVRSDLLENGGNGIECKWPSANTTTTADGSTTNESFENPLVSLECFIFL